MRAAGAYFCLYEVIYQRHSLGRHDGCRHARLSKIIFRVKMIEGKYLNIITYYFCRRRADTRMGEVARHLRPALKAR